MKAVWDLKVAGGTLVIPGLGTMLADVAVEAGRIAAVGTGLGPAREEVDARGRVVLPGLVDPHIHLGNQHSFAAEAGSETAAALAGGVTTVGVFLRSMEPYSPRLAALREEYEAAARVDAFWHLQTFNQAQLDDLAACAAAGVTSFKFYLYGLPGVIPAVDDGFLLAGFRAVAALGPGAVACVHAENEAIVVRATAQVQAERPTGDLADWADTHPDVAEAEAVHRAAYLSAVAGCRLYVVHLSTRMGLEAARQEKAGRATLHIETTSPYLSLTKFDANGLLLKMSPPVRAAEDVEALWCGVLDGTIDTFGTDNTSRDRTTKNAAGGLWQARPGYPVLATHLPSLLHEGYHRRGIPLELLASRACAAPARIYGLYPRKGTIAVGGDADLVVVDLDLEREVRPAELHSFSDFSPFEGKRLRGWPVAVVQAGRLAFRDGEVLSPAGCGRWLARHAG